MAITEIQAKTLLRKYKFVDSWFVSAYGINLYRGCAHACIYCDGRAEKYNVSGCFGEDIEVKINALELLEKELDPARRRKALRKSYFLVAGGVGDGYQAAEEKYQLTRGALKLLDRFEYPVHILTKSDLIQRDLDVLKSIGEKSSVIVSMSFSTVNSQLAAFFEPGVPSPEKRLETLGFLKSHGIKTGVFFMPVIPFLSDTEEELEAAFQAFSNAAVDFVIFGGLTLKPGRQRDFFYQKVKDRFPELIFKYYRLYGNNQWGNAVTDYYKMIHKHFWLIARKYDIPLRIPQKLFESILDENDKIAVMLDQLGYLLKLRGAGSSLEFAARELSKSLGPVRDNQPLLSKLKKSNKQAYDQVLEILESGTSRLYQKFIHNR